MDDEYQCKIEEIFQQLTISSATEENPIPKPTDDVDNNEVSSEEKTFEDVAEQTIRGVDPNASFACLAKCFEGADEVLKSTVTGILNIVLVDDQNIGRAQVVKLTDRAANGGMDPKVVAQHVVLSVAVAMYHTTLKWKKAGSVEMPLPLARMVGSMSMNYIPFDGLLQQFVHFTQKLGIRWPQYKLIPLMLVKNTPMHQEYMMRMFIKHCDRGETLHLVLGANVLKESSIKIILDKLVFGRQFTQFTTIKTHCNLICYLRFVNTIDTFTLGLQKAMQIWGDPIIAQKSSDQDLLRTSQLVIGFLFHLGRDGLIAAKTKLVERLARGLPNHFSVADPRRIELAKFVGDVITETIRWCEGEITEVPEHLKLPEKKNQKDLFRVFHDCPHSSWFWMDEAAIPRESEKVVSEIDVKTGPEIVADDHDADADDDDDDDEDVLEPIETMDSPHPEGKLKYLRNFVEQFPELKTFDEHSHILRDLKTTIKHQLPLEHPSLAIDVLDCLFRWENKFEDLSLDDMRENCLKTALVSSPEKCLSHFCQYFRQDNVYPFRKNLVLKVLHDSMKDFSLRTKKLLVDSVFHHILYDNNAIRDQDVVVRIPLIMFVGQVLCHLPSEMITEDIFVSYLDALVQMNSIDVATKDTICYSLYKVIEVIGDRNITSSMQSSIRNTRLFIEQNT